MCGRFANSETIPAMRAHFAAEGTEIAWTASWNITPTRNIPVLIQDLRSRRLGLMRWGWNPAALGGRLLINCRGEEAHQKRLFTETLIHRRCLVPATLFYEWQPATVPKARPQPFAFADTRSSLFAIAGLWSNRVATDGARIGEVILMTVPANQGRIDRSLGYYQSGFFSSMGLRSRPRDCRTFLKAAHRFSV